MPKPYSLDLRERVVRFVEDGHSRHAAAAHFKVSVSFVVNLMKAVRMRGSFEPKPSGGRRHAKLEPHRSFLLAQIIEKADITMPELAAELAAATGEKADPASLSCWLIRAGYRFKKTRARSILVDGEPGGKKQPDGQTSRQPCFSRREETAEKAPSRRQRGGRSRSPSRNLPLGSWLDGHKSQTA
jgi:transposase